jgi:hypothetical protein
VLAAIVLAATITFTPAADPNNTQGWQASAYTGKWYAEKWAPIRKCIMDRESNHNYRARNPSSSAQGAYQFLDSQWRVSLTHMMMPEALSMSERQAIKNLRKQPIAKWSRYWQDRAFYTAWRHGEGAHHWRITVEGTRECISLKVN